MKTTLNVIAILLVAVVGAQWLWGQDELDQMAVHITSSALLLPSRLILLCIMAWLVRSARRKVAGLPMSSDRFLRRDQTLVLLGFFAVCFIFAFAVDRLGPTPHQTFASASAAAAWDAAGIIGLLFCGGCVVGGGRP